MDGGLEAKLPVQARSQKSAMRGAILEIWGRSPQPAEGIGGVEAKSRAVGSTGVWGRSPQRSKILRFFAKIT